MQCAKMFNWCANSFVWERSEVRLGEGQLVMMWCLGVISLGYTLDVFQPFLA